MNFSKVKKFLIKNKVVIFLFIISTVFFIYQHYVSLSWDFSVYVLNAKYLFSNGNYFEWYRAPFMPFLLFLFSIFGYLASEYIYIVFVSFVFMIASIKLAKKANLNKNLFYALMLSPFVLNFGLIVGTEALSLSLLMLFIAYLHEKKASIFLAFSILTRYTTILYIPIVFFKKNIKEILLAFVIIVIVFSPWILFNFQEKGHPFYSTANSYALNVEYRDYINMPINLLDFLIPIGFYLPFLLFGLYLKAKKKLKTIDWVIIVFTILAIISYIRVPHKEPRYLFNLILPSVYFSMFAFRKIIKKIKNLNVNHVILAFVAINFLLAFFFFVSPRPPAGFNEGKSNLNKNCMSMSNVWPFLNYFDISTEPYTSKNQLKEKIQKGYRILFFKHTQTPYYIQNKTFMESMPIIKQTENYYLLGNNAKCKSIEKVDKSYLERIKSNGRDPKLHPVLPIVSKKD